MDNPLWPARNVAEYAYCPRLFYFREVEGFTFPATTLKKVNVFICESMLPVTRPRSVSARMRKPVSLDRYAA